MNIGRSNNSHVGGRPGFDLANVVQRYCGGGRSKEQADNHVIALLEKKECPIITQDTQSGQAAAVVVASAASTRRMGCGGSMSMREQHSRTRAEQAKASTIGDILLRTPMTYWYCCTPKSPRKPSLKCGPFRAEETADSAQPRNKKYVGTGEGREATPGPW